jgi:hypothetical protein
MARLGGTGSGDVNQPTFRAWDYPPTSLPLPVELTFFTANVNGSTASLNWTTATEINNRGFEIQRKLENAHWKNIGFVPGFGSTTESKSYTYLDNSVSNGKYFYRLKQIDFNGTFAYSSIVEAHVGACIEFALSQNYPNPFNPATTIEFTIPETGLVTLDIYNAVGQKVTSLVNENLKAGVYKKQWNAEGFASGIYYARLTAGTNVKTQKLVLMK